MSSSELVPSDHDRVEAVSNEVQFALVIARMIGTVAHSPEHLRPAVFDLRVTSCRNSSPLRMRRTSSGRSRRSKPHSRRRGIFKAADPARTAAGRSRGNQLR
ncbi:hypothetical protein AYJ54_39310 [Bradyrhizobium centrolobii]|uniref:Uncharacterized protein n=1 Tax=Bradyrhizobium centrolobii TaxID=1505087 RepID=A0A176Z6P6_9BRAD|nr:hypothetical protein AYJ54_39310 [Bradyrhizobium centrolobii]